MTWRLNDTKQEANERLGKMVWHEAKKLKNQPKNQKLTWKCYKMKVADIIDKIISLERIEIEKQIIKNKISFGKFTNGSVRKQGFISLWTYLSAS